MKTMKRPVIAITLLLLLLPMLFCGWLLTTSNGLHWLLTRAALADALEIDTLEGNLLGSLHLTGVRYHDDKIKITLDEAMLSWHPAALWRKELLVEMLYLKHLRIELPPSDDAPLELPDIHLPITVQLDDMQVNDLEIIRPEQPAIRINNASLRATANRGGVIVQYLDISSDIAQLSLKGSLHPYGDYWHNLELQWQLQLAELPTFNGSGQLKGDLRQTTLQHKLTLPARAATELKLFDLLQTPHWQATLQIPKQPLKSVDEGWPNEAVALTARGSGDLNHATVDEFTLDALNSSVHGKGALDWQEKFLWRADVDSKRFDLAALWSLLEVDGPMIGVGVNGKLSGDLDHLNADDVTLRALDGTISGNVQVRWDTPLQWQTQFQARSLALAQLWPLLALDQQGLPAGRADLSTRLSGDANGLRFRQLALQALGATVHGDVQLQWQPQLQWQATLDGQGINPAGWQPQRLAEWPGNLATQLQSRGSYANDKLQGELEIKQLKGTLRHYPFQLQSQLALAQQQLTIKQFKLSSAESNIEAHGSAGKQVDLHLRLDSPQLAQLYPDVQGSLKAEGELRGKQAEPLLQLRLDGKNLAYAGQQIGTLKGRAELQLFSWRQIMVDLQAKELQLAGQKIDAVAINAKGNAADHRLQLHLKMAQLETQWQLSGNFDAATELWLGQVDKADLNNPDLGLWQLRSAAPLSASRDHLKLAPLCWQQQDALLCLDGQQQQETWQATLRGEQLNLSLFSPWLPRDLETEGVLALHASLRYQPQQPLTAEALLTVGAGNVSYPIIEGERSEWHFKEGRWQAALDDRGLHSQLRIALAGSDKIQDQISATLELPGYDPLTTTLADQTMKGEANAAFSDLGLINNLLDEVHGLQGRIELNSRIGGTLSQPALTGQLQLRDGSFQVPRLGLSLSDVQFEASSSGKESLNYRLQMRSGDGAIEAKGETRLNAKEGWPTRVKLTGENFEVSHIPEARVLVSPNLEMKMARRELWLDGEVLVPQAKLQPKEFTSTTRVSDDVVIVGTPESTLPPWQIHNRVRLILGDRVSLYGFGFEGNISGNLLLIDEPGKVTAASGELRVVEGRYRAYGQRLDVEQGRLLFAGGPITNPALDLRAVRHVQEVTAGIKVYGPLRQPQFELFSTPAMGETDALAYLVLGRPLESTTSSSDGALMAQAALAIGLKGGDFLARSIGDRFGIEEMRIESSDNGDNASLVMGRYLSPRLYVGYGVGLIDATNTLNLRYQISQHWQLKAESGTSQSADMIYTIDR